jgi:tetratricopeptide (TPR) repeat protein
VATALARRSSSAPIAPAAALARGLALALAAGTAVWVVASLLLSGQTHAPFRNIDTLTAHQDQQYLALPERLRTVEDRCDFVERRMHEALSRRAPSIALGRALEAADCPQPARFTLLRLMALTQMARWAEASAAAAQLEHQRVEPRYHGQAAYHAGLAHAELGQLARAESELRQARRLGYPSCNLPALLGRLLARRNQLAPAAEEYERAASCTADPRPLLAAASLWAAAAQPARARALLARIDPATLTAEPRRTYDTLRTQLSGAR